MRKIVVILLFVVAASCILIFLSRGYYKNTYTGKYECAKNNVTLILSGDNNCTMINNLYRDVVYLKGNYIIKGDNIKLKLNEGSSGLYRKVYFNGKVEGHSIELYNFYNDGNAVFHLKD